MRPVWVGDQFGDVPYKADHVYPLSSPPPTTESVCMTAKESPTLQGAMPCFLRGGFQRESCCADASGTGHVRAHRPRLRPLEDPAVRARFDVEANGS